MGIKAQELLIAPKPESKPRMIVPSTIRRDNAAVKVSEDERAGGSGILESANKYRPTGIMLRHIRGPMTFRVFEAKINSNFNKFVKKQSLDNIPPEDLDPIATRRLTDIGTRTRIIAIRNIRENFQLSRRAL